MSTKRQSKIWSWTGPEVDHFLRVAGLFTNHDGRGRNSSQPLFAFESCSFQLFRAQKPPNYLVDFIQPGSLCFMFEGQEAVTELQSLKEFPQSGVSLCANRCFLEEQRLGWTFHEGRRVTPLDNICIHRSPWTLPTVVMNYETKNVCSSCFLEPEKVTKSTHLKWKKCLVLSNWCHVSFQHEKVNSVFNHSHCTFPRAAGKNGRRPAIKCTQACGPRGLPATYREEGEEGGIDVKNAGNPRVGKLC